MVRLHIVAEGQTEETFVNGTLREYFAHYSVFADVRCVQTSRRRGRVYRGGMLDYRRFRDDLIRWMKEDDNPDAWFSTMIDLYRLPSDFPGWGANQGRPAPNRRVRTIERAIRQDIRHRRLIPYVQLHEFEALLLAQPAAMRQDFLGRDNEVRQLEALVAQFPTPEQIDSDEPPSKRIQALIPEYAGRKASSGPIVAARIGLDVLSQRCPHFGQWLRWIRNLGRCAAVQGATSTQ